MGAALACGQDGAQARAGCCSSGCSAPAQGGPADNPEYRPKTGREELQEFCEAPPGKHTHLAEEADTTDALSLPGEPDVVHAPAADVKACSSVADPPAGGDTAQEHGATNSAEARSRRWGVGGGAGGAAAGAGAQAQVHLAGSDDHSSNVFEYAVTIDKTAGGRLGIDIEHQHGMCISEIHDGLVKSWNDEHPENPVRCHDIMVGVNGVRGDAVLMAKECKKNQVLVITLRTSRDGI